MEGSIFFGLHEFRPVEDALGIGWSKRWTRRKSDFSGKNIGAIAWNVSWFLDLSTSRSLTAPMRRRRQ
jgi:hypothetical protein